MPVVAAPAALPKLDLTPDSQANPAEPAAEGGACSAGHLLSVEDQLHDALQEQRKTAQPDHELSFPETADDAGEVDLSLLQDAVGSTA